MATPTQRTIYIGTDTGTPGPTTTIIAKQLLSPVNHRLYRSGRTYVQKIDLDPESTNRIEVYALADTWMTHGAWRLAFETYKKHNAEEIKAAGKNRGRWSDFQVAFELGNVGRPLQFDSGFAGVVFTAGEFEDSTVADEGGTDFTFNWISSAGTNFNIIAQYDLAGRTQNTPEDIETTLPYATLDNDSLDATIFQNIQDHGNEPPYNADTIPSTAPLVKIATLQGQYNQAGNTSEGIQKLSTGYFRAPCGIVVLRGNLGSAHTGDVSVTYKEGNYKGVHALPMGE